MENYSELEKELLKAAVAFVVAARKLDAAIQWRSPDHGVSYQRDTPRFLQWYGVRSMHGPSGIGCRQLCIELPGALANIARTCPDLAELVGELQAQLADPAVPPIEHTKKHRPQPASVA
jgi:hypothetical protein